MEKSIKWGHTFNRFTIYKLLTCVPILENSGQIRLSPIMPNNEKDTKNIRKYLNDIVNNDYQFDIENLEEI